MLEVKLQWHYQELPKNNGISDLKIILRDPLTIP